MCGIVGGWSRGSFAALEAALPAMGARLAHRGPDGSGIWTDPDAGVAFAHARLSIVDLSPEGRQPMASPGGRYVATYNGEIYNHAALRDELDRRGASPAWRGHSDTETLLACIEAWGIERAIAESVGMFAMAIWDRRERTLTLLRDRFGEKPLYYGWVGDDFLFASELKALLEHPRFERRISSEAVALYVRHGHVPAPYSIWEGIRKLQPGTRLVLGSHGREARLQAFWSLREVAEAGCKDRLDVDERGAADLVDAALRDSVRGQMVADVPLGALLSGGLDSSLVVALMQAQADRPVRTYSIGFSQRAFDEAPFAAEVARHLGTDHTTLVMGESDVLAMVPRMPDVYDEPFADSSQLPTCMVMQLARRHVTVALSGDGGDELFGGYHRYPLASRLWGLVGWLPPPALDLVAGGLRSLRPAGWLSLAGPTAAIRASAMEDKLQKLGQRLEGVRGFDGLYAALLSEWRSSHVMPGRPEGIPPWMAEVDGSPVDDPVDRMMMVDAISYLPDDILVKVDRAAMATSLEVRAPFLDHRVAELAWKLPPSVKYQAGQGKRVLRTLLERYVPRELTDRPKKGFSVPLNDWLRGPLRDWAESQLSREALEQHGIFDADVVREAWAQHLSGARQYGARLWNISMFQAWYRRYMSAQ